jgi:hypothetical protein
MKTIKRFFSLKTLMTLMAITALVTSSNLHAQVTIGDDKTPQPYSVLELVSKYETSPDKYGGLRLPQLTTAQREGLTLPPADLLTGGLLIHNTTTKCIEYYNGTTWINLCAGGINFSSSSTIHFNPVTNQFELKALSGDVTSAQNNPGVTVNAIQGKEIANTAPGAGDVLTWNNSTNKWEPVNPVTKMPSGTWIYCPPFILEWESGAAKTVNLFTKYTEGLSGYTTGGANNSTTTPTQVANRVAAATDFEYLVRHSGPNITITGINATTGVLSYTCTTVAPTAADFVSVVLIKK